MFSFHHYQHLLGPPVKKEHILKSVVDMDEGTKPIHFDHIFAWSNTNEEMKEAEADKEDTYDTSHDVPEDTSVPPPPSLKSSQIQELMAQFELSKLLASHNFASCLPTDLKELPSKFTKLSGEIKELKHDLTSAANGRSNKAVRQNDRVKGWKTLYDLVKTRLDQLTQTKQELKIDLNMLRTINLSLPSVGLGFSRALKGALDKVICKPGDISCWVSLLVLPLCLLKTFAQGFQLVMRRPAESSLAMLDVDDEHLNIGDATLKDLKTKHHFKHASSLPVIPIDHHYLIASPAMVLDRIKRFPRGTSYGWDI
ncbi:hypothetical protein Tco_1154824 [Tanacetum coccineum]